MRFGKTSELTLHTIILLVLFVTLIKEVFALKGRLFLAEGFVFAGLLAIAIFGMQRFIKNGATQALLFVYAVSIVNALMLYAWERPLYAGVLVVAALGILILMKKMPEAKPESTEEPWATSEVKIDEVPTEHGVYSSPAFEQNTPETKKTLKRKTTKTSKKKRR